MDHPTDRITHTTTFVTPVMEHWLEREIRYIYVDVIHSFKGSFNTLCEGTLICKNANQYTDITSIKELLS